MTFKTYQILVVPTTKGLSNDQLKWVQTELKQKAEVALRCGAPTNAAVEVCTVLLYGNRSDSWTNLMQRPAHVIFSKEGPTWNPTYDQAFWLWVNGSTWATPPDEVWCCGGAGQTRHGGRGVSSQIWRKAQERGYSTKFKFIPSWGLAFDDLQPVKRK